MLALVLALSALASLLSARSLHLSVLLFVFGVGCVCLRSACCFSLLLLSSQPILLMVLESIASKIAIISLSSVDSNVVDLSRIVAALFAPPSLAARVFVSRLARSENLWLALNVTWRDIKFNVSSGTNSPQDNLFIFEFTKDEDLESAMCLGL